MSVKLYQPFRLKDSGFLMLVENLDTKASCLLRHYVALACQNVKRGIVYVRSTPKKQLALTGIDKNCIHAVNLLDVYSPLSSLSKSLSDAFVAAKGQSGKPIVLIESLNAFVMFFGISKTVALVHEWATREMCKVFGVFHTDGAEKEELEALKSYAEVFVQTQNSGNLDSDAVYESAHESFQIWWEQKTASGSLTSGVELLTLDAKSAKLLSRMDIRDSPVSLNAGDSSKATGDPISRLTFKLSLSDSEKAAREEVDLPYIKAQTRQTEGGSMKKDSQIHYIPDVDDDYDEEDPDDDLDI